MHTAVCSLSEMTFGLAPGEVGREANGGEVGRTEEEGEKE